MISKVTVPTGECGDFRIERKYVKPSPVSNWRLGSRYIPDGEYTFLYHKDTLWMSDTPAEMRDHYEPVQKATGHVLIVGGGIGMVLNAVAQKKEVTHVTIVELEQDVINLIKPHYDNLYPGKLTFICCDVFKWKPDKNAFYDVAWYDIWPFIDMDNYEGMKKLHRKFAKKTGWQGSWCRKEVKRLVDQDKAETSY